MKKTKDKTSKEIVQEDIGKYSALEAVKNSEGGRIIIESLKKDIVACLDELSSKYKESIYEDLVAISAKLSERLIMYRMITRSSKNKHLAMDELEEILEESREE